MKSYSREVAAGLGSVMLSMIVGTFIAAWCGVNITPVQPIIAGTCTPILISCLAPFISKSIQQHMDGRVDAAKR